MIRNRACGICLQNDKILLIKHSPAVKSPVFWSPPGGRVNLYETLEEALQREFLEETGLEITIKKLLFVNEFISQPIHALEYFFEVEILGGQLIKGIDPELAQDQQIIAEVEFLSLDNLNKLPKNYVHNLFWEVEKLEDILKMQGLYQWKA